MTAKSVQRRARLSGALESTVDGEWITLDEMMVVWGVSKGTLVNTINVIPDFPQVDHVGERNRVFYPRRAALEALKRWEHRGDAVNADHSRRLNAILGVETDTAHEALPISEMSKASALRAEVEQRMVEQRQLVHRQDQAAVSGRVFEIISRTLSNLGTVCDPNGRWPPEMREAADKAGRERLLRIHAEMKDMLTGNEGLDQPRRNSAPRKRAGAPGAARVSGQGVGRVAEPTGHGATGAVDHDKSVGGKRAPVRKREK